MAWLNQHRLDLWVKSNVGIAVASGTTWDPANKASSITLSGGNLIATEGTPVGFDAVRSAANSTASQKVYFEFTLTLQASRTGVGFSNSSAPLTDPSTFPGSAVVSTACYLLCDLGKFLCSSSADNNTTVLPGSVTGDAIDLALNTATQLVWFRKNNGAWNASAAGTQDPATGQGGMSVPFAGPYYAVGCFDGDIGDKFTARFSTGSWLDSAPAGFTQLS